MILFQTWDSLHIILNFQHAKLDSTVWGHANHQTYPNHEFGFIYFKSCLCFLGQKFFIFFIFLGFGGSNYFWNNMFKRNIKGKQRKSAFVQEIAIDKGIFVVFVKHHCIMIGIEKWKKWSSKLKKFCFVKSKWCDIKVIIFLCEFFCEEWSI